MFFRCASLLLETLYLHDGKSVMHISARVDVGGQWSVHRHAEHVLLVSNYNMAIHTAEVSQLLTEREREKWRRQKVEKIIIIIIKFPNKVYTV